MTKKIKVEGFGFKSSQSIQHGTWRVYGSRAPHSREMVEEFQVTQTKDGRVEWPAFELEPTCSPDAARGRRRFFFYYLVPVDADGRETWHGEDSALVLPAELPREFGGRIDVAEWMLYNLELTGVIAPGQLHT